MSSKSTNQQSQVTQFASQLGFGVPGGNSAVQWSYEEIIKSRNMAKRLLNQYYDTRKYGDQKELLQILTYGKSKPKYNRDTLEIIAVETLQSMMKVAKTYKSNIYNLEVEAFEPQFASDIANSIILELIEHQHAYNSERNEKTRKFIKNRMLDVKSDLESAEESLKLFKQVNRNIMESPQLQLEQGRLSRDVEVLAGVYMTLQQQLEMAKIKEVEEEEYVVTLDEPNIALYPSRPNKKLLVIIFSFFGFAVGISLAFLKDYIQNCNIEGKNILKELKILVR